MLTKKIVFLSFFALLVTSAKSEITKGSVNIFNKSGRLISFILYDNVRIDCGDYEGELQTMVIYLPSTKEYFDGEKKFKKGDFLIDSTGRKIGEVISIPFDYMPLYSSRDNKYTIRLSGYISPIDIQPISIPENYLEEIITKNKNTLNLSVFEQFFSDFGFENDSTFKDYGYSQYYFLRYDSYLGNIRLRFLFKHDKLIAILHSRKINTFGFEDIKLETAYVMWIKANDRSAMKKFIDSYKYNFETPE